MPPARWGRSIHMRRRSAWRLCNAIGAWRSRKGARRAFDALSFDESRHPVVNAQLCNGCGACECACTALVYGAFAGGSRRGIVVVGVATYEKLGATVVDGQEV